LREAAVTCFAAAAEALPRLGATAEVREAVAEFTDRYVARGRCPADDLLSRFHSQFHGQLDGKDIRT
jgi:glutamate--cysteine ligase